MLRGRWRPLSIDSIDSFEADLLGNPAGTSLQLFFQLSPAQRAVMAHFQTGITAVAGQSGNLGLQHLATNDFSGSPFYLRHQTGSLLVGWQLMAEWQWVAISVPRAVETGEHFDWLSLRIGQLHSPPLGFENPSAADQDVLLVLQDNAGNQSAHPLDHYGRIPPPDPAFISPQRAVSHMNTLRIPTADLNGIDLTKVEFVYLMFSPGTSGTLMVDSLEWHRD
jgi:hypothetical protein